MQAQKQFFFAGKTRSVAWRLRQLHQLKSTIKKHESTLLTALHRDLGKPEFEVYTGEIYPVIKEIDYFIQHLCELARPTKKSTSLLLWPSTSYVFPTPFGTVLIMAPWNFPFQLTMIPLIGAVAAGNCAVLKPSEFAPHTSALIATIVRDCFDPEHVTVKQGDAQTAQALLDEPFDYIFFTGSTRVGKIVMHKAADQLIPITLELGGKNPCIIDESCALDLAAKRITWGKFYNAGQNCVSPDYVLIHATKKDQFINKVRTYIEQFYGTHPQQSPDYARIISQAHIERLKRLLQTSHIVYGGTIDAQSRFIAPTIVDNITLESSVMQEEIFGPILPIITYTTLDEALNIVKRLPKPLALYIFSTHENMQRALITATQSGNVCINDVLIQAASTELPFGGVGASGMGRYHGKASFTTFSYERAIVENSSWFDLPIRYAPYTLLQRIIKRLIM